MNAPSVPEPAPQQPDWSSDGRLGHVLDDLSERPPLVDAESCLALRDELRLAARGEAFILQAGECAERFSECRPGPVRAKAAQLHDLADSWEDQAGAPVIRVGRFAGQFAKPRSSPTEVLPDGTVLPSYRGDAVNDPRPTPEARRPNPGRLLSAYDSAAQAIDSLAVKQLLLTPGAYGLSAGLAPTYISHEALLLDYEKALVRDDGRGGSGYDSSAHLVWIGERTRQPGGAHLEFASTLVNPVGLKVGPTAAPADVQEAVTRLVAGNPAGRLTVICRMGADQVRHRLPPLLAELGPVAQDIVWMCDPMHGNTVRTQRGQKTRVVTDLFDEVEQFCSVLRTHRVHPGGLHLEITPDEVTECVDSRADLAAETPLPRYTTACDPRLNPGQADWLVTKAAALLTRN